MNGDRGAVNHWRPNQLSADSGTCGPHHLVRTEGALHIQMLALLECRQCRMWVTEWVPPLKSACCVGCTRT